jgi:uncharacterized protein (DUF1501 family)
MITRHDFLQPAAADPVDNVLVVVFLRGGADGLTLVPPVGDDVYYGARPTLAVDRGDAIDLDGYFALNPRLAPLMPHYDSGDLLIVHGAGSEDTTRSHFEAQDTMEHAGDAGGGWLGRYLRAAVPRPSALSAVAIGTTRPESLRGAPGGAVMQTLRDFALEEHGDGFLDQLQRLYAIERGPLGAAAGDTIAAVRRLRELRASDDAPANGAVYPATRFGRGLREIARLVKSNLGLVATTIDLDGWDTHFVQAGVIGSLLDQLGEGLAAFLADLGEARHRVTVVTMTEFGRRLRENSSFGTDHGAGSVMMVCTPGAGGAGRLVSGWSNLEDEGLIGPGDVPVGINYRDVLAPVLRRHAPGVDLARVFPGFEVRRLPA